MSANNTDVHTTITSSTVQHQLPTTGSEQHVFTPFREQRRQQIEAQPESEEERLIRLWDELRARQLDALGWTDTSRTIPDFYRETTAPWTWGPGGPVVDDGPFGHGEQRVEGVGMRAALVRSRFELLNNVPGVPELGSDPVGAIASRPNLTIETSPSPDEPQASIQTIVFSLFEPHELPLPSSPDSMRNLEAEAHRLHEVFRTIGEPLVTTMYENAGLGLPMPIISDDRRAEISRLDAAMSDVHDHFASMRDDVSDLRPSTIPRDQDYQRAGTDHGQSVAVNTVPSSRATYTPTYEPIHPAISNAEHLRLRAHIIYIKRSMAEMATRFVIADRGPQYLIPAPEDRSRFYAMVSDSIDLFDYLYGDLAIMEADAAKENSFRLSAVERFLETLRILSVDELTTEQDDCSICREPYDAGLDGGIVRLPCSHTFGRQCIAAWLSTSNKPSCPMCRTTLFRAPPALPPVEPTSLEVIAMNQAWAARITQDPDVGRLEVWRGAEDLLDYIGSVNYQTSQMLDTRFGWGNSSFDPNQPISFVDSAYGPIDARYLRPAGSRWRRERSFAGLVIDMFRLFSSRPDASGERDPEIARELAGLMGTLYERLWEHMRVMGHPTVWTFFGPPTSSLIDPATIPQVEDALQRLVEVENDMLTRTKGLAPITE